jgi:hypothetical protein
MKQAMAARLDISVDVVSIGSDSSLGKWPKAAVASSANNFARAVMNRCCGGVKKH